MKIIISLVLFILIIQTSIAQSDKDIKEKEVPQQIKDFVKGNYSDAKAIKYYKEIEGDTTFYEVVFKYQNDQYAILFYTDGRLYETEIVRKFEKLPVNARKNISNDLKNRFIKYSIQLVEEVNPALLSKYEVKVRARKKDHSGYYELFYDRNGFFISEEEVILKSIPSNSGF